MPALRCQGHTGVPAGRTGRDSGRAGSLRGGDPLAAGQQDANEPHGLARTASWGGQRVSFSFPIDILTGTRPHLRAGRPMGPSLSASPPLILALRFGI